MRRHTQSLPQSACLDILRAGAWGVLALHGANGYPYAPPLNYALLEHEGHLPAICMHSALTGHKMDAVQANPQASFTVVGQSLVVPEKVTDFFRSVIAFGRVRIADDPALKMRALQALGGKYCPDHAEVVAADIEKSFERCAVLVMDIEHLTGKEAIELVRARADAGAPNATQLA